MQSNQNFKYDVFLSHSSKDKPAVRELAQRLKADGLRVWFDEWEIRPGQHFLKKINEGLETSKVLVVCMSQQLFDSDWLTQEYDAILSRDPTNEERRLLPLRLDDAEIPPRLRQFLYVDWREKSDKQYAMLLAACREMLGMPQLPQPKPPENLVDACRSGNCVLYAGAGLSAPASFPTWKRFVTALIGWVETDKAISPRLIHSLRNAIGGGEFDLAADGIVGELEKRNELPRLHEFLRTTFDKGVTLTHRHELIRELKFSAILTTNFDTLLERTFPGASVRVFTPLDIEPLLELSAKREFFIAKLYGCLDRPETLLVSPAQYKDAIVGNRRFAEFIESIFVSRTLLFLGSSLDGISAYLEGIRFRGGEQKHHAVVAVSDPAWESKAEMLRRRYGIEVLPYTESRDHAEVGEFLRTLLQSVQPEKEGPATGEIQDWQEQQGRTQLKRILLKNIGPFADLELELTPNWNILLGDNGVGKTTILRSLTLAICGRDAQAYAQRIVRTGQSKAQITLETANGRKYVTEIFETSSGFEVESLPRRPLDTEGWLVLAFPPVRSATWRKLTGPQGEQPRKRPRIEDLLPLLTAMPDPRLDDVKQWIINLDYWKSKTDAAGRHPASYYEHLQQRLFEIIKKLTGGLKIDFARVDPKSWEVLVTTDDGTVPFDAVSQGTASVIGWTGVLLQRLFDVFDDSTDPLNQYAIVILDEIDAHMHPKWQQSLISNLSDLFPNVQFIATTHSPLIVGGMRKDQVVRLARDESGVVQIVEIPADMLLGRTDQILTGDLFGLASTLSLGEKGEKLMAEYEELLGISKKTEEQERRYRGLHSALESLLPPASVETKLERRAQQLVNAILTADYSPDKVNVLKKKLMEKTREVAQSMGWKEFL
jgi:predicted ATPase